MSWFRKSLRLAVVVGLAFASTAAKKEDDGKAKTERKKDDKKEEKKDGKGDKKPASEAPADKGSQKLSIPVPPGHDAKGLVIPYRDEKGMMQMRFTMDVGNRVDADHLAMKKLLIETFDEAGQGEMTIELPDSVLDLNTRVISTETGAVIKRSDFELTGKTMEFNTSTRAGRIGGKVRMLIYNLENETNPSTEAKPSEK